MSTPADDQKILWEAVIEIAHLRADYTSAYVDRKQKAWRKSSWTSADADRFEREAVQQWNANHPALIALWKFQKEHADALKAPVSSSEDTPARVWQEGDEIPADVRIVYGKRGRMSRQAAAQNRGPDGWWAPGTGVISEQRLLAEHGPVSEVPAAGEPA